METVVGKKRTGFWVLIAILAVSGVLAALIVVFGAFDSIAYSIVWRVFVADLYLVASLAAQHTWLRRTAWIATGFTFVLGMVNVFWRFTPYYRWADGRSSYTVGDPSTGWSPWYGFNEDLEAAAHLILVGVIMLGFVSLAYRWISEERLMRGIYVATFVATCVSVLLCAILIVDSGHRWNLSEDLGRVAAGAAILALTAAAIVTIAAFVQRRAAKSAVRDGRPVAPNPAAAVLPQALDTHVPGVPGSPAATDDELRSLVRGYVDEYLRERGL